ncbi:unnamed protein product [Rotaria sp. Silwood2]|nr:unnamed protein product [Rotaria sp. Silwood2]CAF4424775.1 unnamed protein product [Rotaria sp. Silwood2]
MIARANLRIVEALGRKVAAPLFFLPNVVQVDRINTLRVSYYNGSIRLPLPNPHQITFLNSQKCLNHASSLSTSVCSIRLLPLNHHNNNQYTRWFEILHSLSTLPNLHSLRITMYRRPAIVYDNCCPLIEKITLQVTDFGFYFREKYNTLRSGDLPIFQQYAQFIKHLCHRILLLSSDKQSCYSIEDDHCGLTIWF